MSLLPPAGPGPECAAAEPEILDRRQGPYGEVVLRRHGGRFQIIANGCFLMDTSDGRSERLLVRAAHAELFRDGPPARAPRVLIGGLGVGFSLIEAADEPSWGRISVVEREEAVIDWHRSGPLGGLTARALADPRTELLHADLLDQLSGRARPLPDGGYDALCLDIDNGPDWTVTEGNGSLYSPAGLAACAAALAPGGVLAVWSARPSSNFEEAMRNSGFSGVRTEEVAVVRGVPDAVHLAVKPA
ncbi:spermidine synthase [Streptomyces sp. XM4193]|uniref:spermidine synthase n=1 Tax=Streptomyces sp. XM4193 TaxID=2929782 RepID=UPI001FF92F44|nr:spermidine synthase [Streptomyces sp. XM4193]MCK1797418.1 spermidine synthase [Streptomyces sp. XM4193]